MIRTLLIVVVTVIAFAVPVEAGSPGPPRSTIEKLFHSQVVVTGKVTHIAAETVLAASTAGEGDKVDFKIATIKIETGIAGAENITHVRVGFRPAPKPNPDPNAKRPLRGTPPIIELKEGQQMLLYLVKHPTADFYIMPWMNPPVDATSDAGKQELQTIQNVAKVIADPLKGLKSDKAEVRAATAATMILKYRSYPDFGGAVKEVAIPAAESKLILDALTEVEWSGRNPRLQSLGGPPPITAFYQLYLTEQNGWKAPEVKPGVDYTEAYRAEFIRWRAGPGKDYVIKQIVPDTKPKK